MPQHLLPHLDSRPAVQCVLIAATVLVLAACGPDTDTISDTENNEKAPSGAVTQTEQCLLAAAESPCALLTEGLVRQALSLSAEVGIESDEYQIGRGSCDLHWSAGRKGSLQLANGAELAIDLDDEIGLSEIKQLASEPDTAAQMFAAATRQRTDSEKEAIAQRTQQVMANSGQIDQQYKDEAQELAGTMAKQLSFQSVADVGDAAAWGGIGKIKHLHVRVGKVQFLVSAQVAATEQANIDAARQVARELITHCSG